MLQRVTGLATLMLFVLGTLMLAGCDRPSAQPFWETAWEEVDVFDLVSLDPNVYDDPAQGDPMFHSWRELGRMTIADPTKRDSLIAALRQGRAEHDGLVAECFDPHHAIHMKHEGQVIDVVICFRCMQMLVLVNGQSRGKWFVSKSPQPTFDAMLRTANVPLLPSELPPDD